MSAALAKSGRRVLPGFDVLPDDPDLLTEYQLLLDHCTAALTRRQESYPTLVERGDLAADDAQADIAAWTLLVQEWRWIVSGEGEAPHFGTLFDRIAAIDLALDRVDRAIERTGFRPQLRYQRSCNQALRWHLGHQIHGDPAVHFWAAATHAARAHAVNQLCTVCARRRADPSTRSCTRTDCGLALRAVPGAATLATEMKEQAA